MVLQLQFDSFTEDARVLGIRFMRLYSNAPNAHSDSDSDTAPLAAAPSTGFTLSDFINCFIARFSDVDFASSAVGWAALTAFRNACSDMGSS